MSDEMIRAYEEVFPESKLCFLSPSGDMTAVDLENNKEFVKPFEETEEVFMDRIRRSQEQGETSSLRNGRYTSMNGKPNPT